ncbi:MAG: PEP-CTERM sorting domain-containing protein [Okeania sp. SIO2F4]|uniref:PEP-CTERM sorting domain-containing protein n=1 Tax=Okeania sp. SIO2F4 TaxID=2607790 RepID=UPI0014291FCE|nr:PEP-CTERM sorting domain-containing protein [Okeania sp. SIO2F4]NES02148.1 PEP-CTERM sorting domain-containing protein [Okeania sp. SIO2F4]
MMKKISIATTGALLIALGSTVAAQAATIVFQTKGADSGENINNGENDFFSVFFKDGLEDSFIKSVAFDLTTDPNGVFRFSPLPEIGEGDGVSIANITEAILGDGEKTVTSLVVDNEFTPPADTLDGQIRILGANFADGTFNPGDTFTFGANTTVVGNGDLPFRDRDNPDAEVDRLDPGGDFAGVNVSVVLSNGSNSATATGSFDFVDVETAIAVLNIPESIPEPTTIFGLFAVGGLGASLLKNKQKH